MVHLSNTLAVIPIPNDALLASAFLKHYENSFKYTQRPVVAYILDRPKRATKNLFRNHFKVDLLRRSALFKNNGIDHKYTISFSNKTAVIINDSSLKTGPMVSNVIKYFDAKYNLVIEPGTLLLPNHNKILTAVRREDSWGSIYINSIEIDRKYFNRLNPESLDFTLYTHYQKYYRTSHRYSSSVIKPSKSCVILMKKDLLKEVPFDVINKDSGYLDEFCMKCMYESTSEILTIYNDFSALQLGGIYEE